MRMRQKHLALAGICIATFGCQAQPRGIEDTRMWIGGCPSVQTETHKSLELAAQAFTLIGGKLIDTGIGVLGAALTAAGSDKVETRGAGSNIDSLTKIQGCVVLITGSFFSNAEEAGAAASTSGDWIAVGEPMLDRQKKALRNVLSANLKASGIYLAAQPTMYLELQIVKTRQGDSFFLRPILISYQRPMLKSSWGSYSGERDIVVSGAIASSSGEAAAPALFTFKNWSAPVHGYFEPLDAAQLQSCQSNATPPGTPGPQSASGAANSVTPPQDVGQLPAGGGNTNRSNNNVNFSRLCGGLQSGWMVVPQGAGPWRFSMAYSETRHGSQFVKALGDAITADKEKLGSLAKQAVFRSERQAAEEKLHQAEIKAMEDKDALVAAALSAQNAASVSLEKCDAITSGAAPSEALTALNDYRTARRKAMTAFAKAQSPAEFDLSKLPERSVCGAT